MSIHIDMAAAGRLAVRSTDRLPTRTRSTMIIGIVTADREAIIDLIVRGSTGLDEVVQAVIDTGFDGSLSLPPSLIARLQLA